MNMVEEPDTQVEPGTPGDGSLGLGMMVAIFAAGPIFLLQVTLLVILVDLLTMARPPSVAGYLGFALISAPFATLVGAAIALIPVLIGGMAMNTLAQDWAWARRPIAWLAAGALLGAAMATQFGPHAGALGIPLIITSMACAGICRGFARRGLTGRAQGRPRSALTPGGYHG